MKKFLALAIAAALMTVAIGASADTNTVTVSAAVTGTCRFAALTSTLGFGALDPNSSADGAASVSVDFWCTRGTTAAITDDDGLYELGVNGNRMRHATDATEFVPYSLSYSASSLTGNGPGTPRTLTITGAIANANYVNALAGGYQDTVVITLAP